MAFSNEVTEIKTEKEKLTQNLEKAEVYISDIQKENSELREEFQKN